MTGNVTNNKNYDGQVNRCGEKGGRFESLNPEFILRMEEEGGQIKSAGNEVQKMRTKWLKGAFGDVSEDGVRNAKTGREAGEKDEPFFKLQIPDSGN